MKNIKCQNCNNVQSAKWQFCHKCLINLHPNNYMFGTIQKPSYQSLTNKINPSTMKAGEETKYFEAVEYEKNKEIRGSSKARSYEEGRKREWQKYKHEWKRRGSKISELSNMRKSQ